MRDDRAINPKSELRVATTERRGSLDQEGREEYLANSKHMPRPQRMESA